MADTLNDKLQDLCDTCENGEQLLAGLQDLGVELPDEALENVAGGVLAGRPFAGTDILEAMRLNLTGGFKQAGDIVAFLQTKISDGMEQLAGGELDDRLRPQLRL